MFNIQIAKDDLAEALSYVESTVGNNSQNFGDDCVSITDMGTNTLDIYTTNGIEFSRVQVVLTSGSSGKTERMPYVNYKRFKSMIDSIPDREYISIKATVNDIEINYGTRKKPLKLTGSTNGIIPLPQNSGAVITINKDIVENGLTQACSIIKDDTNSALTNCIRIHTDAFNVEITAVDIKNNRMFVHKGVTTESNNGDVIIEANKFKKAFKLFKDFRDLEFECGTNVIKVSGADPVNRSSQMIMGVEYYSRVLAGNYPTTVGAMFNNVTEFAVVNKDELKSSLIRINAIEDNTIGSGTMELKIDKNMVNIVKTSQYGTVEDSFSLENEIGTPIIETFKAKPLAEVLKNFTDNGTYGTPNTFEIGKSNSNSNANYYVLKETGATGSMFLITGFGSASPTNP